MNYYLPIKNTVKYIAILLILIFGLTACSQVDNPGREENQKALNLKAYFPMHQGMEYSYAGEGNEFAPFTRRIMFARDNYLQLTDDNGGTVIVKVYKYNDNEITEVFSEGEFYGDENIIPDVQDNEEKGEIILKTPLEVGNSWSGDDGDREIVAVDQEVKVPAGTFYQVIKIKISYQDSDNTRYEYYAPNIGLINSEYIGEGFEIVSELESFTLNDE